jgi:CRP-like cAMP-binding protein
LAKARPKESAKSAAYDPAVALEFFSSAGKPQDFVKGATIFSENRMGLPLLLMPNRVYLLLEGEVGLFAGEEHIASIHSGEVFGEMAAMGGTARSASALAMFDCKVIGLDDAQFRAALRKKPAFALMLMGVMAARLRDTLLRLGGTPPADTGWREAAALEPQLLEDLVQVVGPAAVFRHPAGKMIMREGQRGVALYAVLEGRVEIRIGETVVEKVGPGGVFGEMSLVERQPRLASAVAETDCALLAMSRHMFLHLVKQSPKFGAALLKAVGERAGYMASRLGEAETLQGKAAA